MVQVFAFLLVVVLLVAGWNQSFKEQYMRINGQAPLQSRQVSKPVQTSTVASELKPEAPLRRSGDWMFNETSLDHPYGGKKAIK